MRIPTSKIYRAFQELDEFSDEQCERFMQRISVSGDKRAMPVLAFIIVTLFSLVLSCIASGIIADQLPSARGSATVTIYDFFLFLFMIGIPLFLGLLARDFVLRRNLRSVINEKLERIRCLSCKYILIGQVVHDNAVTCPECGLVMSLGQLGIVEADLIPPRMDDPTGHSFV